jgi:hypothetical protein
MMEVIQEMGNCEECGAEINLAEAWRVDELNCISFNIQIII